jgi:hypothetical protein
MQNRDEQNIIAQAEAFTRTVFVFVLSRDLTTFPTL